MITREEILEYCQEKGVKLEEHFPQSFIPSFDRGSFSQGGIMNRIIAKTDSSYQLGIEYKTGIWYWWEAYVLDSYDDYSNKLHFTHRYNCGNGATQRGMKGSVAELAILKSQGAFYAFINFSGKEFRDEFNDNPKLPSFYEVADIVTGKIKDGKIISCSHKLSSIDEQAILIQNNSVS